MRRVSGWLSLAVLAACIMPGAALAVWSGDGLASGRVAAATIPAEPAPTVTATGRSVTVSWPAGTVQAQGVTGYTVKRYNGAVAQTVGSGCAGTIATLSCTESSLPAGTWTYTVTPSLYAWIGSESPQSSPVTIQSPGLTITSAATLTSLPATVKVSLTSYLPGQTVAFKLDGATGTTLTSTLSPASIPASGAATATITIPTGTAQGAHTIYAVGSQGDTATGDLTVNRPAVSTAVIAKSAGGVSGYIKQGGTYYVYANVTGSGTPPAGLATLTADVSAVSTGQIAATLTSGTYTIDGQTYNYRSAQLTANSTLVAGSDAFSVKLTDTAATATTTSYSVIVDNTAPRASDVQTANATGGTAGKPEQGDSMTLTYSEPIDPSTILVGWDGGAQSVVVEIVDGGSSQNDKLVVLNASTGGQLPLGTVGLGRKDYVSGTITYGASGAASTMVVSANSIVITLGTASAAAGTAPGPGTLIWTPSATVSDRAGNAASTAAATESGSADKDF